jgi:hypothetical protein
LFYYFEKNLSLSFVLLNKASTPYHHHPWRKEIEIWGPGPKKYVEYLKPDILPLNGLVM